VVKIKITTDKTVDSTHNFDIQFSMNATDNRSFNQADDWSYNSSTTYVSTSAITLANANGTVVGGTAPVTDRPTLLSLARQKLKHVVIIMQENRSFDSYFGDFPGANGKSNAPAATAYSCSCKDGSGVTHSVSNKYYNPAKNTGTLDWDFPHGNGDAVIEMPAGTGGLPIKNFLDRAVASRCEYCDDAILKQIVGYHTDSDNTTGDNTLYNYPMHNYWTMAKNFILQDAMFESAPSWSKVSHLFMVSGWSAACTANQAARAAGDYKYSCTDNVNDVNPVNLNNGTGPFYLWDNITHLLTTHSPPVFWTYYKGENWDYLCGMCRANPMSCFTGDDPFLYGDLWMPLQYFKSVSDDQTQNFVGQSLALFYFMTMAGGDYAPAVTWIVPANKVSEHAGIPNNIDLRWGETYVTAIVQSIMANSYLWPSTAIFLSWDDWGGFYDHARPPANSGYGLRVPGITMSPWVNQAGYVDKQTLSHDAYLKFIEDIFLEGKRLGDNDNRTYRRENASQLGDLLNEFDFNRTPMSAPTEVKDVLFCWMPYY